MRLGCGLAVSPFLFPLRFYDSFVFPVRWLWSLTIVAVDSHVRAGARGAVGKVCGLGVTWQLEPRRGPAEDGLAGLFRWGPLMLASSGLSSWTSSLSPEESLLVFCVEGVAQSGGEERRGGAVSACPVPACTSSAAFRVRSPLHLTAVLPPETLCPALSRERTSSLGPGHGRDGRSAAQSCGFCLPFKLFRLSHDPDRPARLLPHVRSDRGH